MTCGVADGFLCQSIKLGGSSMVVKKHGLWNAIFALYPKHLADRMGQLQQPVHQSVGTGCHRLQATRQSAHLAHRLGEQIVKQPGTARGCREVSRQIQLQLFGLASNACKQCV